MSQPDLAILLLEDSPADARYVQLMLQRTPGFQCHVTHFPRLEQALAARITERVDLVLLDLSLPDSHWIETLRRLRAGWPDVPVVVLSGFDDPPFVQRTLRHGASAYLIKGQFDTEALSKAIAEATGIQTEPVWVAG